MSAGGSGSISHMIRQVKANRRLQKQRRERLRHKLDTLRRRSKGSDFRAFNPQFQQSRKAEIAENQRRLRTEIKNIRRTNSVKNMISLVLTALIFLIWLDKCW